VDLHAKLACIDVSIGEAAISSRNNLVTFFRKSEKLTEKFVAELTFRGCSQSCVLRLKFLRSVSLDNDPEKSRSVVLRHVSPQLSNLGRKDRRRNSHGLPNALNSALA